MTPKTEHTISMRSLAAIILMASGGGWLAGNFIMPTDPLWNMLFHGISLPILLIFALPLLNGARWASIAMNIFAVVGIVGLIVMIVLGLSNSNPEAIGVKSTQDWIPAIISIFGSLLWLTTLIPSQRGETVTATAATTSSR